MTASSGHGAGILSVRILSHALEQAGLKVLGNLLDLLLRNPFLMGTAGRDVLSLRRVISATTHRRIEAPKHRRTNSQHLRSEGKREE